MGQTHNELRRGDLSRALKNLLADSRGGGLERYGETLTPVIDMWSRPEFALLRGEALFGEIEPVPAVVGELGMAGIVVPAASGMLAVVFAAVRSGSAAAWQFGLATEVAVLATLTVGPQVQNVDGRRGPIAVNPATGSDPASIYTTVAAYQLNTPAASDQDRVFAGPLIVRPGQAAIVLGTTANTAGTCQFSGYVRRAYPTELNL